MAQKNLAYLKLEQIRMDGGTQQRVDYNKDVIEDYAEAIEDGAEFPPIVVYEDAQKNYWLADGFYRMRAHLRAAKGVIYAEIRYGTQRDAILCSCGVNNDHGYKRSKDDERKAVNTLLDDDEWGKWSSRVIADKCHVSHTLVDTIRAERRVEAEKKESAGASGKCLPDKTKVPQKETRTVTRGGRTYTMKVNVGQKAPLPPKVTDRDKLKANMERLTGLLKDALELANKLGAKKTARHTEKALEAVNEDHAAMSAALN